MRLTSSLIVVTIIACVVIPLLGLFVLVRLGLLNNDEFITSFWSDLSAGYISGIKSGVFTGLVVGVVVWRIEKIPAI